MSKQMVDDDTLMLTEPCQPVFALDEMKRNADHAATLLRTLANVDRLLLLCRLSEGELCVGDLEREVKISQPTLSQQLGVLRQENLVETRRQGKNIFYRIKPGPSMLVLQAVHEAFCKKG